MKILKIALIFLGIALFGVSVIAKELTPARHILLTSCKSDQLEFAIWTQVPFFTCLERALKANPDIFTSSNLAGTTILAPGEITSTDSSGLNVAGILTLGVNDSIFKFELDIRQFDTPIAVLSSKETSMTLRCSAIAEVARRRKCDGPR